MSALRSTLLVLSLLVPGIPAAHAETLTCTDVPTLPATLSAPGHYCLNKNFSQVFTSAAVNIAASNVVLDCNDHTVTQTGLSGVSGVYASNRSQLIVQGCRLNGFGRGISLFETAVGQSQGNQILDNAVRGAQLAGIQVAGSSNVIDDNHVSGNVGSPAQASSYGIFVTSFGNAGTGNQVRHNLVSRFIPNASVYPIGIYVADSEGNTIADNVVESLWAPQGRVAYGIYGNINVRNTIAVRNHVTAADGLPPSGSQVYGGASNVGILFDGPVSSLAHNLCRENNVGHWITDVPTDSEQGGCLKLDNLEY
jgi:hypothetical protein